MPNVNPVEFLLPTCHEVNRFKCVPNSNGFLTFLLLWEVLLHLHYSSTSAVCRDQEIITVWWQFLGKGLLTNLQIQMGRPTRNSPG